MKEVTVYAIAFVASLFCMLVGVALIRTGTAGTFGAVLAGVGAWFAVDAMFAYGDLKHPAMTAVKRSAPRRGGCRTR